MPELTPTHRAVLDIESRSWHCQGCREQAARELGMSPTRYAQVLGWLLDQPAAEAEYPQVVRRLRRLRDARAAVRSRRVA